MGATTRSTPPRRRLLEHVDVDLDASGGPGAPGPTSTALVPGCHQLCQRRSPDRKGSVPDVDGDDITAFATGRPPAWSGVFRDGRGRRHNVRGL